MEDTKKRFLSHVRFDASGCWIWAGGTGNAGYGRFWLNGKTGSAHRAAYLLFTENIEKGKWIHHICQNKLCVNPAHLSQVTSREHRQLHPDPSGHAAKTHCKHGHEFSPENTRVKADGSRDCRACNRISAANRRKANPAPRSRGRPQKTHCPHGHPLEGDNLIINSGSRRCRICNNAAQRARYQRRAQQEQELARERYKRKAQEDPGFWRRYPSRQ